MENCKSWWKYVMLAESWHVTRKDVSAAIASAQTNFRSGHLGVIILLAKGLNPDEHGFAIKQLLNPPEVTMKPDGTSTRNWKKCGARLDRLVCSKGDTVMDVVPAGWQTHEQFLEKNPLWRNEANTFIFHRDKKVSLPCRHQLSGLCYIHAPEVLQHYLVSLKQPKVGMIDMTKMVRKNFSSDQLAAHVFDDAGGSSHALLRNILTPGSALTGSHSTLYEDHLKQYGPGLVTAFKVYPKFLEAEAPWRYDGSPAGKPCGTHIMVLIGARQDAQTKKRYFLLQNWWKNSQFVEVSETYLEACEAFVMFVKTEQLEIPKEFPTDPHLIAENESVDKPENVMFDPYPVCPPKETWADAIRQ